MNNINKECGFKISQAWNPTIRFLQLSDTDMFNNIEWNRPTDPLLLQVKLSWRREGVHSELSIKSVQQVAMLPQNREVK
jgi:hypothetical protein